MKLLLILFCLITLLPYLFGYVRCNGFEVHGIRRIALALISGIIFTLIIGLPLLGLLALFGFKKPLNAVFSFSCSLSYV